VRTDEAAEQEAELKASREAVLADQPDPAWRIPDSAAGIKMSVDAARSFAKTEADAFLTATPSYYPCKKNWDLMRGYLEAQGVNIPDRNVFAAAFARLSELGLLEQTALEPTPEPAPEPEPDQQPIDTVSAEMELLDGWDLQTGEPHKYRLYEVNRMSADEYRLAFRVSPRFTRGYFG
jgi:hypothetical protein